MVPTSTKGKEKVIEEKSKRRPFARSYSRKLMVDAMKANAASIANNIKKRKFKVAKFQTPSTGVVDVSCEKSEKEFVRVLLEERKESPKKKAHKRKNKTTSITIAGKKLSGEKGNGEAPQEKRESSKRKRENPQVEQKIS